MILRKVKSGNFLLSAISVCTAFLIILFASYRTTASSEFATEKKAGFSSFIGLTEHHSLSSSPVTAPSPAIFLKKGHSSRTSFTSKYIQVVPQTVWIPHSEYSLTRMTVLISQQLRLHLALRVLRI